MLTANTNLREHLLQAVLDPELRRIIYHIAGSAKYIGNMMGEANRKLAGTTNTTGDQQLELDILANQILIERLRRDTSFGINEFASEELNRILRLDTNSGNFSIAADPLDGSSLVEVNLSIGTIIAIYKGSILDKKSGRQKLLAAMSILYGPLTTLIYAAGKGTHEFVLNPTGDYVLATGNIRMNDQGTLYSPGGLKKDWLPEHSKYITALEESGHKLRYSGAFVADVNQILLKRGGMFTYPALKKAPNGKLRLLFELQPMAYLIEQAGGRATNGKEDILDIVANNIDQRSPIYLGSKMEVDLAAEYLK
ncbi:MAG: fructose-1,6-bisphosphatase [Planctomycetes bacterium]|nr:fructose-1,6-bisphosphatase [Planctomycetota bacterium]